MQQGDAPVGAEAIAKASAHSCVNGLIRGNLLEVQQVGASEFLDRAVHCHAAGCKFSIKNYKTNQSLGPVHTESIISECGEKHLGNSEAAEQCVVTFILLIKLD